MRLHLRVRGFLLSNGFTVRGFHFDRGRLALVLIMQDIALIVHLTGCEFLGGSLRVQLLHVDARCLAHGLAEGSAGIFLSCADVEHKGLIGGFHGPAVRIMRVLALLHASVRQTGSSAIDSHRVDAVIIARLLKLDFFDRLAF